jgi:hypothetical protein
MFPSYLTRSPIEYTKDLSEADVSSQDLAFFGDAKGIERLKEFRNIRRVWLIGANQKQFDYIVSSVNPVVFKGYNLKVHDLSALQGFSNIKELSIEWNTKAESIAPVGELTSLRFLQIQNFTKVHDLSPLQGLSELIALDVSGGVWSTFKVGTLNPLGYLKNLRYLCLTNIKVSDELLAPISKLTQLEKMVISNQFPTEEYARLAATLPDTKCDYFRAYIELTQMIGKHDIMVIGKGKPLLNRTRDWERIEKYQKAFAHLVEKLKPQQDRNSNV